MSKRSACRARLITALAGLTLLGTALFGAQAARAQIGTLPGWMNDSLQLQNQYLTLWQYFRNADTTRFNLWTNIGNPESTLDDQFFVTNAMGALVSPWGGYRIVSGFRPINDNSR